MGSICETNRVGENKPLSQTSDVVPSPGVWTRGAYHRSLIYSLRHCANAVQPGATLLNPTSWGIASQDNTSVACSCSKDHTNGLDLALDQGHKKCRDCNKLVGYYFTQRIVLPIH